MEKEKMIAAMRKIIDKASPNTKAILFGSRARGDCRQDSDWDLLVLLDKDKVTHSDQDNIAYPLTELGWNTGETINPILLTLSYWDAHSYTPFHHNVASEGIEI